MARVWLEGFEDGMLFGDYLQSQPSNPLAGWDLNSVTSGASTGWTGGITIRSGRNAYSQKSMRVDSSHVIAKYQLSSALMEGYFRYHCKI